jgi:triphosphoribosyl-dephospho-CoA synthase
MISFMPHDERLSIGQCATLACLLEATTPKPGNVHRGVDFEDMTFLDFAVSAAAIGPAMDRAREWGVGQTILEAIHATRRLVPVNTNLGTVLLIAPLAAVPRDLPLPVGIAAVLQSLTAHDARSVYEAIRVVHPGGLGKVDRLDVADEPPNDLLVAMQAAAGRDLVARQYGNGFEQVLHGVVPSLRRGQQLGWSLTDTVIHTQVTLLSQFSDSLIERKCGPEVARQVSANAAQVLAAGGPGDESYVEALSDLDFWLRTDGHRRNPGTTADLLAAGLFAALRDGVLQPPFR